MKELINTNSASAQGESVPIRVITPPKGWAPLDLREVWRYRELLFFLTWRDVKVRYKQTVLGASWAIIQPFLSMVIFSIIFGQLAKLPSGGIPYPLLTYSALVPWTFFSTGLTKSSDSLVGSAYLIKKVYFPRLLIPISSVLSGVVDFALAFVVLIGMMAYYGYWPGAGIWSLPVLLVLSGMASLGVGLWLSAMNVQFRDVKYVVPFLVQFWLYASPVAYIGTIIPEKWRLVYALNPMVGVVAGFRWALLGNPASSAEPMVQELLAKAQFLLGNPVSSAEPMAFPGMEILVSTLVSAALLVSGAYYFRRMEKSFADVV